MLRAYSFVVIAAAGAALAAFNSPVYASTLDSEIEASAKQSYVFKTLLNGDDVEIRSKDGAVTLTGTVSDESKKSLAGETFAALVHVEKVDNKLKVNRESPASLHSRKEENHA